MCLDAIAITNHSVAIAPTNFSRGARCK